MKGRKDGLIVYGLFLILLAVAVLATYTNVGRCVECMVLDRPGAEKPWAERFLGCSNVVQHIVSEACSNVSQSSGEVPGWTVMTPADPSREARVTVAFMKERGVKRLVFYPRVGGQDAEVAILEDISLPGLLFLLRGAPGPWTPLAGQYAFNLDCLEYGFEDKPFDATVTVILRGKSAQLWTKDGMVFF